MAALRDEIDTRLGGQLAGELTEVWPAFPRRRLTRGLAEALEPLELTARVDLLADRLARALPQPFPAAVEVLWRALDSPSFVGWMTLPCGSFVAKRGISDPEVALPLLAGLTPRWSSEGPIRPFIERHPELTYDHLRRWATDADEHVRRLVSEGTRPRLPWAPQLRGLIADPSPNLPLLDVLVDDSSPYVRRSVANHLNDISKDHPRLAIELARGWIARSDGPAWVVRHGLRTLVKRGDPDALQLLGVATDADIRLTDLAIDRSQVPIGDEATFTFTVELSPQQPNAVDAVIDYRVHYLGATGVKAPKVFKLTRRRLQPGIPVIVTRRHRFEHVSIRRILPGPHAIDVQVNGRVLGSTTIEVTPAA
jgi:3-methyladenine DNA glycosylase AlkC